jgi:8-oxo-dGTP pyrophosphatase MutT (NUDIX family)/GNAT superfamily N-acetyltransferase/general stress protein YciG
VDFRAFVRRTADDQHGEPYAEAGSVDLMEPAACSYCGSAEFEPQQDDNGRVQRATCAACGGTMVSHGGQWMPDLIGQPDNHPRMNSDPRSGGVGGTGNAPVPRREEDLSSRTAGFWSPHTDWEKHGDIGPVHRGLMIHRPDPGSLSEPEIHVWNGSPRHEVANAIMDHVNERADQRGGLGMSWTTDHDHAREVARAGGWHRSSGGQGLAVVLHAAAPHHDHIERDDATLRHNDVTPFHEGGESEVPLKRGAPAHLTGVSWHDDMQLNNGEGGWVTHHFDHPIQHTAMPSLKHPLDPDLLTWQVRHHREDDDDFDENDVYPDLEHERPGWNHHTLNAHLPGYPHPSGHIDYSTRDDDMPALRVHRMHVVPADRGKGIASAMQDKLRELHPAHMFDHGSRTPAGESWATQYQDPGDPKLDLDHPDNVHAWSRYVSARTAGTDWCRHRHAEHCWLPRQAPAGGVALYVPQDRGVCPWTTPQTQQINCPVSEPGPMAGMNRSAAMNLPGDAEFHFTPSYAPTKNHELEMHSGGQSIGKVDWFPSDGHVNAVETHHRYQRRGVGSALLSKAHELSEQHGLPYSNESAFYTPAGAGLLKNHEQRGLADVSHIPTHHHEGPGAEGGSIQEHMIKDHGFAASADNIHAMDEAGVHSWHDKVRQFSPCGWKNASLSTTSVWVEPEWRFHVLAAWRDVRWKAVDIRRGGGVSIVSALAETITGHVQGDTGVYETQINYVPGSRKIGFWQCGCAWASYAWGRSPAYQRFEGRMCSHALALTYEAQSRGMFGREISEDTTRPGWMRDKVRVRHDRQTGDHDLRAAQRLLDPDGVYPADHGLDLERSPIHAFAIEAYAARQDPADVLRVFLAAGIDHGDARELALSCIGDRVVADVQLQDLEQLGDHLHLAKAEEKPAEPTHAGVALKAADTGRVLMIQRSHQDENDPAAGTWEFPGGGREPGDPTSLHSGIREFEEEVGHEFPTGGHVSHVWQSGNGVYQGHVVVVPHEKAIDFSQGRRTVNPDDPDGDDHEQSAWWHPDDARKNPALRSECKDSPWDKIKKASLLRTADYAAADGLEDVGVDWRPKAPPKAPERGQDVNPGSTGFATGQDPPEWDSASQNPSTMSMTMWSNLHDEPEPALPSTDGAEGVVEDPGERYRSQMSPQIDGGDDLTPSDGRTAAVAAFHASAGAQALQGTERTTNVDIADAARQHLAGNGIQRTALRAFTPQEQHELINEGRGQQARNFGDLKIEGTHYEALTEALAKEQSLADPEDLFD